MKLIIDGDVNKYYVQMLCMIYFPGAKFGNDEQETADNPTLELKVSRNNQGVDAYAELRYMHKICSSHKHADFSDGMTHDRTQKIVIGEAVLAAAAQVLHPELLYLSGFSSDPLWHFQAHAQT